VADFFSRFFQLPISLAWEAFGENNGVRSVLEMREMISKYRRVPIGPLDNPSIGCILLAEPFFFDETHWIPVSSDCSLNIVQGKGYISNDGATGQALWADVTAMLRFVVDSKFDPGPASIGAVET
jgi:putative restriction endonuclease